jgi:hypothetical protein
LVFDQQVKCGKISINVPIEWDVLQDDEYIFEYKVFLMTVSLVENLVEVACAAIDNQYTLEQTLLQGNMIQFSNSMVWGILTR